MKDLRNDITEQIDEFREILTRYLQGQKMDHEEMEAIRNMTIRMSIYELVEIQPQETEKQFTRHIA